MLKVIQPYEFIQLDSPSISHLAKTQNELYFQPNDLKGSTLCPKYAQAYVVDTTEQHKSITRMQRLHCSSQGGTATGLPVLSHL